MICGNIKIMDCNTAIISLSFAHVLTLGIFANYRIKVNKQLIELEKEEKKDKEKISNMEKRMKFLEEKIQNRK